MLCLPIPTPVHMRGAAVALAVWTGHRWRPSNVAEL
jgi:hypothetical protein